MGPSGLERNAVHIGLDHLFVKREEISGPLYCDGDFFLNAKCRISHFRGQLTAQLDLWRCMHSSFGTDADMLLFNFLLDWFLFFFFSPVELDWIGFYRSMNLNSLSLSLPIEKSIKFYVLAIIDYVDTFIY